MPILNTLLNGFRSAAGAGTRARPVAGPRRRPLLPGVSAGEGAENRRTIEALLKSEADGVVPDIYAEEIASRGPAGRAYFHDFDRQLRERDPERADRVLRQIAGRLEAVDRQRVHDDLPPTAARKRRREERKHAPAPEDDGERDLLDVFLDVFRDIVEGEAKERLAEEVTGQPDREKKAVQQQKPGRRPPRVPPSPDGWGGGRGGGGGVGGGYPRFPNPKDPRGPIDRWLPKL